MAADRISLAALSALEQAAFTAHLAGVVEHSPWVAQGAWAARPFATVDALHRAMMQVLAQAGAEAGLAVLRLHPALATPAKLSPASASEQGRLGLDRMPAPDAEAMAALNRRYQARFGFPFIIAVRGQKDPAAIRAALERRLDNTQAAERATALAEVAAIARFRLGDLIDG
ncbi:MAG: 2-oxo-4-hydroxy-4-carboxy-5-ureidoimidazoline decarboxylase [Acetobacteraceae bacterium]